MIAQKKIAIIGCGNLGLSILNGLLADKSISPQFLTATRRNIELLESYKPQGVTITDDNVKAVEDSDIIILALKPYKILEILAFLKPYFNSDKHILISLATGIKISQIQEVVEINLPIYRAMPNTAADVGMSMTCICSNVSDSQTTSLVRSCFNTIGNTIFIEESLMDSATVLGACGIAYVLRFIRGMIQDGIEIGFDSKTATEIVTHTVKGAAELLIEGKQHPEYEIDKVTTPKGCTITGLNEMEHNGFSSALIKGIISSYNKIE